MLSQSPRAAHFFRFSKGSPQTGQTFDSRVAAPPPARLPPRPAIRAQSPCVPRTCFQNFEKLLNGMPGIG